MFIQRLEELLAEEKISKYKLSRDLELSKSTIWNWQNGCQPTADKLIKLADYFQVSIDYLVGRSNDIGIIQTNANLSDLQNDLLAAVAKLPMDYQREVLGYAQGLAGKRNFV